MFTYFLQIEGAKVTKSSVFAKNLMKKHRLAPAMYWYWYALARNFVFAGENFQIRTDKSSVVDPKIFFLGFGSKNLLAGFGF
jgi:hypothetical protein